MNTSNRHTGGKPRRNRKSVDPKWDNNPLVKPVVKTDAIDYHNDFTWYNKHATYLESVAQVSSNHARGTPLGRVCDIAQDAINHTYCAEASAISMVVAPTACGRNNNVFNTAQVALYQFIRAANSGSRNYETADLFMYILAVKEFLSYLGMFKRLLLSLTYYEVNDRTVPKALIAAQLGIYEHGEVDALMKLLIQNKYELLAKLNSWITQFNTLAIPGNMPILQKAYWMFNHVFKTDDLLKPTYACYSPATFLEFDPTGSKEGGRLVSIPNWTNIRGIDDAQEIYDGILETGSRMLNAIMVSEDVAIISGDIRKAFGNENLMIVAPLDFNKDSLIIHDAIEIKDQMHNARLWGDAIKLADYSIEQRGGYIHDNTLVTCHGTTPYTWIAARSPIIDIPADKVNVEKFVEATRLTGALGDRYYVYTDFWAAYDCIVYFYQDSLTPSSNEGWLGAYSLAFDTIELQYLRTVLTGNSDYIPLVVVSDEPVFFTEDYYSIQGGDTMYTGHFRLYNPIHNVFKTTEIALRNILEATILSELNIPFIKS